MANRTKADEVDEPTPPNPRKRAPARSIEARENQLIAMAMDEAEKRIANGTATSQLLTEFIRLGTTKAMLEREAKAKEVELLEAKAQQIKSQETVEELYSKAIEAMRKYGGSGGDDYEN